MSGDAKKGGDAKGKKAPTKFEKLEAELESYFASWVEIVQPLNPFRITPVVPKPVEPEPGLFSGFKKITKGNSGLAVEELRIRLAGFGGILPGTEFDDALLGAVKRFEKDVMGRGPIGQVDMDFAKALDAFAAAHPLSFTKKLKCPCGTCGGFGKGRHKDEYSSKYAASKNEAGHKYEYPGIHRSLLWACRSLIHYGSVIHKDKIRFMAFSSGYRCHDDNKLHVDPTTKKARSSTNHMGKAVDLNFESKVGDKWVRDPSKAQTSTDADAMRQIAQDKLGAQVSWNSTDKFALEPGGKGAGHAPTWVHMDVRTWNRDALDDHYFVQNLIDLDGTPMATLLVRPGSFE